VFWQGRVWQAGLIETLARSKPITTQVISVPVYVEMPDGQFVKTQKAFGDLELQKRILETCRLTETERRDLKRYLRMPTVD
jgi:hypothetical protein